MEDRELLSLERIMREWKTWKALLDKGTFGANDHGEPAKGVQQKWWIPEWIPVTYDGSGNHHMLDLAPAKGGKLGQIVGFWHDAAERTVDGTDFLTWLADADWGDPDHVEEAEETAANGDFVRYEMEQKFWAVRLGQLVHRSFRQTGNRGPGAGEELQQRGRRQERARQAGRGEGQEGTRTGLSHQPERRARHGRRRSIALRSGQAFNSAALFRVAREHTSTQRLEGGARGEGLVDAEFVVPYENAGEHTERDESDPVGHVGRFDRAFGCVVRPSDNEPRAISVPALQVDAAKRDVVAEERHPRRVPPLVRFPLTEVPIRFQPIEHLADRA